MKDIYNLLESNYVEDDDAMFRFAYPIEFLRWALTPPEWSKELHIAVRTSSNKRIVAVITGVPVVLSVNGENIKMVEINFLCVLKALRSKRLAPLLIKEVTRRVNLNGVWQAIYTAGIKIPTPIASATYYHRNLNPRKLVEVGFSGINKAMKRFKDPMKQLEKLNRLPSEYTIPGFRPMEKKDHEAVLALLSEYLKKFTISPVFDLKDFEHWLTTHENVIYAFVVEDPESKAITDFGSFYNLPSTITNHKNYKVLKAAYLYFYAASKTPLNDLIRNLLIAAKNMDYDVFNALNIHDNASFFEELQFGIGSGNLHYYLFNYKTPNLTPNQIGITML